MATTKFYLDLRGKAKDGKGSVVITLYHNSMKVTIPTGVRMSSSEWNNGKGITPALLEKKSETDKAIALLSLSSDIDSLTAAEVKKLIKKAREPKKTGHPVSEVFKDYLSTMRLKPKTQILYDLTLKKIKSFSGDMDIKTLDLKWLRQFDKYLSQSQETNGKAVYLRCLRAVMNYARDEEINCPYPFSKFQIKHSETEKRSISVQDLRRFYTFPLAFPRTEVFRDYFFLMFFLIGINSKDLLLAKKSQMRNGRLEYTREKTGKKYSVKIEPEAKMLIEKYKGKGDYLLDALDRCKHYTSFAREINEGLRLIGIRDGEKITPLIPDITTYFARHTWATLAYEIDIPIDIISQALGHSMGNRTTLIYVKPDRAKVDEANRKVIDYFLTSPE